MKKRLTATLLSLCLLLTLLPAPVFAAGAADSGIPSAQNMVTQQNNAGGYSMATPSDAQPEECTCETLCTGDNINEDCPVCGAGEVDLTTCKGVESQPGTQAKAAPARTITPRIAYDTLWIGNTRITDSGYWATDGNGNLTASDASNYNVAFDADSNTLTLNNANIAAQFDQTYNNSNAGIYAYNSSNAVSLTIQVIGNNVVSGSIGICALSNGGEVSVNISGGGSLTAGGSQSGLWVQSNVSNAALTIEGTAVEASGGNYTGLNGVLVQAGESFSGSLSVDGGSLTASGNAGIQFWFGTGVSGSGTPSLTVAGNAVVDAKSGGIAHNSSNNLSIQGNSGIVFGHDRSDSKAGTVYGSVTLQEDLEIGEGESLTLDKNASLNTGDHNVIVDGGKLDDSIKTNLGDSVKYTPTITTTTLTDGRVGEPYSASLGADGTAPITWSVTTGSLPAGLTLKNDGTITGIPTAAGASTFTVTATNTVGSDNSVATDSKQFTLTIDVSVESVSLDKTTLELTEDSTETLTATITPNNATNKTVTWESSDTSIATVDASGKVTAISAGSATITVTTVDGNKTATCAVTVTEKPVYSISATPATLNFGSIDDGQAAPAAQTVTITNTGNRNVTVNLPTSTNYTITAGTGFTNGTATLEPNATTTFTVQPKAGLSAGTYNESLTISGSDSVHAEIALTFTVNKRPYTGKYSYEIVSDVGENGTIDVDRYATEGDQVTITISPDEAYLLDDLTVTSGGRDVALTDNGDGTYTFTMPSGDVAITATFAEDPNWEDPADPATDVSEIFTDVPANHWAKAAIQYVYDNGLMTGVSDTTFAPEATTTRAMIVSMLARMENVTSAADAGFTDVTASDWYATAVNWAAANGIVSGIGDNTFAPNAPITREQLAAMLMKYAKYKGLDTTARADLSAYSDQPSAWAEDVVSWAVAEGLLAGVTDDQLQPQGQATRAQVAAILQRFLEA